MAVVVGADDDRVAVDRHRVSESVARLDVAGREARGLRHVGPSRGRAHEDVGRVAGTERLLVTFDVLGDWLREKGFCGCLFINASAEFPIHDDRIHAAAAEHKRLMDDYLCELATAAGLEEPETIADQIGLLLEGAIVKAQVTGDCEAASQARRAAEVLLRHHPRS